MPDNKPRTMKVIVFGASGEVGSRVVAEAASRGHRVTAVSRREPSPGRHHLSVATLVRDVESASDLMEVIAEHDLVISALRPPDGEEPKLVPLTVAVVEAARAADKRFIVVGGAAPLRMPETPEHTVLTAPGFLPESSVLIAIACQQQHDWCVDHLESRGSYICPPAMLTPGTRTGSYRIGSDTLVVDEQGSSSISMEDFAVAVLDEAEHPQHAGQKFTVGY
ncbi:MAG: NAD(P)H-binding protein [Planctomycetes bacterium]|nr:NAD(P)H-binding protein [Planctomycetota bacterium]